MYYGWLCTCPIFFLLLKAPWGLGPCICMSVLLIFVYLSVFCSSWYFKVVACTWKFHSFISTHIYEVFVCQTLCYALGPWDAMVWQHPRRKDRICPCIHSLKQQTYAECLQWARRRARCWGAKTDKILASWSLQTSEGTGNQLLITQEANLVWQLDGGSQGETWVKIGLISMCESLMVGGRRPSSQTGSRVTAAGA